MNRAIRTAASGMNAQQLYIDTVANNLANVNTTSYKKNRVDFQDLLYQSLRTAGSSTLEGTFVPTELQIGNGTRMVASQKIFTQGVINPTGNPLDIAIQGDGFFQISRPDGTVLYSRDGAFKRSDQGVMVTADGLELEPQIAIPDDALSISIGEDGVVMAQLVGQTELANVGAIEIVKFMNPAGLRAMGKNLYEATQASGDPIPGTPGAEGLGYLQQATLETSNVQIVEEMVSMIVGQRAYEVSSKAVQAADDMMNIANNLKR